MKNFIALILIFTSTVSFAQQQPLLAQYQFNQLSINPAYTGVNNMTSIDLQYRQQWAGLDGAPQTALLSVQTSLMKNSLGVGVIVNQDKAGIITNTNMGLTSSYKIYIEDGTSLSFGLQTSWNSLTYDYEALNLEDISDEDFIGADNSLKKINFGTGIFISSRHFYLGASIPRILKTAASDNGISGERLSRHYYFTGGVILDPLNTIKLKPYTIFRLVEDGPYSYDLGVNVLLLKTLWAGAFTRDLHDFGLSLHLQMQNGIRIGYSGELTTDELVSSVSAHEISLGFDFVWFDDQEVISRDY